MICRPPATAGSPVLRPVEAKSNMPRLEVLDDSSVFSSGDQTKRDVYDLKFRTDLKGITAVRLEVLPDERLPKHGPGRIFYEGPFGDFFLSEITVKADGKPVKLARASPKNAAGAIDGKPEAIARRAGGRPIDARAGVIQTARGIFGRAAAAAGAAVVIDPQIEPQRIIVAEVEILRIQTHPHSS